jgi:hypothetical protein
MNKKDIKKILLEVAGYPVSGGVKEIADAQAQALADALAETKKAETASKETRVIEPTETR